MCVFSQFMFGSPPPHNLSIDAEALARAAFGRGSGKIFLDNVRCTGEEQRLIDCRANDIGVHNCGHSEDAGVRCLGTSDSISTSIYSID